MNIELPSMPTSRSRSSARGVQTIVPRNVTNGAGGQTLLADGERPPTPTAGHRTPLLPNNGEAVSSVGFGRSGTPASANNGVDPLRNATHLQEKILNITNGGTGGNNTNNANDNNNSKDQGIPNPSRFALVQSVGIILVALGLVVFVYKKKFLKFSIAFTITTLASSWKDQALAVRNDWTPFWHHLVHCVSATIAFITMVYPSSGFFGMDDLEGAADALIIVMAPMFSMSVYKKTNLTNLSFYTMFLESCTFLFKPWSECTTKSIDEETGSGTAATTGHIAVKTFLRMELLVLAWAIIVLYFRCILFGSIGKKHKVGLGLVLLAQGVPAVNFFSGILNTDMSAYAWMTNRLLSARGCFCILWGLRAVDVMEPFDEWKAFFEVFGWYLFLPLPHLIFGGVLGGKYKYVTYHMEANSQQENSALRELIDGLTDIDVVEELQAALDNKKNELLAIAAS